MALRLDLVNVSLARGLLLVVMSLRFLLLPDYNWPSDYLTRSSSCSYFNSWTNWFRTCDNACDLSVAQKLPIFDFIVVGSGAAGSVIANRLASKNNQWKILLIEAGGEPLVDSVVPTFFAFSTNTSSSFNYYEQPSPRYSNALKNGSGCYAGKAIGGSTSINAMLWNCGCDENFNDWAIAANDPSWNYENFQQYLKKPQNVQDPSGSLFSGNCGTYQGTSGPVILNNVDSDTDDISPIVRAAASELGYPYKSNINCGRPFTGFGNIPMSINAGQRQSAARSYIRPLTEFKNVYMMLNSMVSKITTEQDSSGAWIATGVIVSTSLSKCPSIRLQASREVIISAGSYNSPLILQRSGIGRAEDISSCNITHISDVPAGRNLNDHITAISYFTIPGSGSSMLSTTLFFASQALQYLINFTGYLSRIPGLNYQGFINTIDRTASCPDMQITTAKYDQNLADFDIALNDKQSYKPEYVRQLLDINKRSALVAIEATVLNPKSTGSIKINSCTNPYVRPIINGNHFSDPSDLDTLVRGLMFVCNLMNTTAARNAEIQPFRLDIPECNSFDLCTDAYFRCYSKYFSRNFLHATGTCRMGSSPANGVVDSRLRVFGVKKLRVADASVIPKVPAGNTQCPTYAVGEKAADMIIADNL